MYSVTAGWVALNIHMALVDYGYCTHTCTCTQTVCRQLLFFLFTLELLLPPHLFLDLFDSLGGVCAKVVQDFEVQLQGSTVGDFVEELPVAWPHVVGLEECLWVGEVTWWSCESHMKKMVIT